LSTGVNKNTDKQNINNNSSGMLRELETGQDEHVIGNHRKTGIGKKMGIGVVGKTENDKSVSGSSGNFDYSS
jgi:hypothetical protein